MINICWCCDCLWLLTVLFALFQAFSNFGFGGDGGFQFSFGIGAFPFGIFASTFNFNDGRPAARKLLFSGMYYTLWKLCVCFCVGGGAGWGWGRGGGGEGEWLDGKAVGRWALMYVCICHHLHVSEVCDCMSNVSLIEQRKRGTSLQLARTRCKSLPFYLFFL